jgi:hypothetical protein
MNYKELRRNGLLRNALYGQLTKRRIRIEPFYLIRETCQNGKLTEIKTSLSPCETVILKPSDFREIAARRDRDQSEEEMIAMMEKGLVCMGIKHNNQIVAHGWYELGHLTSSYFSFPLKENEAYMSGARTLVSYRGNNLAAYLRYQMYKHLTSLGIEKFYSLTLYSNVPSLRFKQKLGAEILKLYVSVHLPKFRRCILLRTYRTRDH